MVGGVADSAPHREGQPTSKAENTRRISVGRGRERGRTLPSMAEERMKVPSSNGKTRRRRFATRPRLPHSGLMSRGQLDHACIQIHTDHATLVPSGRRANCDKTRSAGNVENVIGRLECRHGDQTLLPGLHEERHVLLVELRRVSNHCQALPRLCLDRMPTSPMSRAVTRRLDWLVMRHEVQTGYIGNTSNREHG